MTGAIITTKSTPSKRRNQWLGDLGFWQQENSEDNTQRLSRLRRNLRIARQSELTDRQQQMLELYFDQGLTMAEIARELNVHRSTVSRTLQRARERLREHLQYSL